MNVFVGGSSTSAGAAELSFVSTAGAHMHATHISESGVIVWDSLQYFAARQYAAQCPQNIVVREYLQRESCPSFMTHGNATALQDVVAQSSRHVCVAWSKVTFIAHVAQR